MYKSTILRNLAQELETLITYLLGFTQALFLLGFIVTYAYKPRNKRVKLLATIMLLWVVLISKDVIMKLYFGDRSVDDFWKMFLLFSDIAIIPLVVIYYTELISPNWITKKRTWICLIPYVSLFLLYPIGSLLGMNTSYWGKSLIIATIVLYITVFLVISIRMIMRYKHTRTRECDPHFANISTKRITSLGGAVIGVSVAFIAYTLMQNDYTSVIYYIFVIFFWWHIFFKTLRYTPEQGSIRIQNGNDQLTQDDQNHSLNKVKQQKLSSAIEREFNDNRIYLNPDLSVGILAVVIGTNRTYLSSYFNHTLHMSFYDYVNRCRIEQAAIPMLEDPDSITKIEDIALMSGFHSSSTFRRAFMRLKNTTPQEYRRSCHANHVKMSLKYFGTKYDTITTETIKINIY